MSETTQDKMNFDYDGRTFSFAGLVFVNLLLQILTLGIFRFWARTRERRFLWSHVSLGEDRLEYTGRGLELFLGFLIVMIVLIPIGAIFQGLSLAVGDSEPGIIIVTVLYITGLMFLIHLAIYRTRRYRLSRTLWRGIRGTLTGSPVRYALVAMAWRNLWRNRGRTLVTASALALGYLSAVLMVGLTDGMSAELIENGTGLLVGQVQVHSDTYLPERNMHRTIGGYEGTDVQALLGRVDASLDVVAASPRLFGGGLISSGDQTQAALLLGIDPERLRSWLTSLLESYHEGALRPVIGGTFPLESAADAHRVCANFERVIRHSATASS